MAPRGKSNTSTDRSPAHSQDIVISKWFTDAERLVQRGAQLKADDIARLLQSLNPRYFRASTRTRYCCSYIKPGMEKYASTKWHLSNSS